MSRVLVSIIANDVKRMFYNVEIALRTCDLDFVLCELPIWKHAYHMLHSIDQWFINPAEYSEPPFHTPGLNSLNQFDSNALSREALLQYFSSIKQKVLAYLDDLSDEELSETPEGCRFTRLTLILGNYRHTYAHLGNINATTMMATGRWPRVVGLDGDLSQGLYE